MSEKEKLLDLLTLIELEVSEEGLEDCEKLREEIISLGQSELFE